jgi:4-amino-4-deoxy-L-arabinose transferase-like glycosyltransferase
MPSRRYGLLLILIVCLGAWLRLGDPGLTEFKRDEANLSQLALDLVRGESFAWLGIVSSVGIPNSPMSVYLLAIPYAFSSSPLLATQFIGLLNLVGLLLVAVLAQRYYGDGVSLLATLLYAVSPWAIIYSRKIWAQDMLPPFIVGTVFLALLALVERKRWAGWLCLPMLVITAQIHYSAVLLVIPLAILLLIHRTGIPRTFWFGLIPAALLCIPFLIGLLGADLLNPARIQQVLENQVNVSENANLPAWNASAIQYTALTISGTDIHSLTGPQVFREFLASLPDLYPLFNALSLGLLLGTLWLLVRAWRLRDQRRSVDIALLSLLLTPIIAFSIPWTTVYPHYFILLMPAAFLIIAVASVDLGGWLARWRPIQRVYTFLGLLLVIVILAGQLVYWSRLTDTLATRFTPDGFGTPVSYLMTVRQAVLARQPGQVVARVGGSAIGLEGEPTVWNFLLADLPLVRFTDDRTLLLYSATPGVLLTAGCVGETRGQQFPLREPAEGCYAVGELPEQMTLVLPTAPQWSNGVRMHLSAWDTASGCLALTWSVSQPASVDYFFKVHLMGSTGARVAVADGPAWPGRYWRAGDVLQSRYCASADVDLSTVKGVQLGMYTYDGVNFGNVDVLDALGNPAGQSIEMALE